MAQQNINIGSSANKGDGDPIRTAFSKAENNFTDLYTRLVVVEGQVGVSNQGGATIQQSIIGDVIGADSTVIVNHATSTVTAQNIVGNLKGSVVGDDSTVIIDGVSKKFLAASIDITLNETGEIYASAFSNSVTGKFLLSLPAGKNYGISVSTEGYLFHSENFDLPKGDGFNIVTKNIELNKISVGSNITLKNVFFDTGKWGINEDSYAELDRLFDLLLLRPSLRVEISGHTDNIGTESFNTLLSQRRADAVVNYLVEKGVKRRRFIAKGYGQFRPVSSNDTDEGRANNRRTEFEIISQ